MTDTGPTNTFFKVEFFYLIGAYNPTSSAAYNLPLLSEDGSLVISEDQDRETFIEVTARLEWLPDHIYRALDPRTQVSTGAPPIKLQLSERDGTGAILRYWPSNTTNILIDPSAEAGLWVRAITRDWTARTVTIRLSTKEPFLNDRIRLAGTSVDTAATTVRALVNYSLTDVFGGDVLNDYATIVNSTAIPAGDRRLFQPGQSHMDLIKSELDAIDCRVYDEYGVIWTALARTGTLGQVRLSTAPEYGTDCDPIVWEVADTLSRDGRWYDGVLIEYDTRAFGGTVAWQRSGAGAHTRGQVVNRDRPAPTANAADKLVTRTSIRGRDTDVIARARLDVRSRMTAAIFTFDATLQGAIRAVEYSFPEGTMRLRIEQ